MHMNEYEAEKEHELKDFLNYKIIYKVGEGSYGTVYKAKNEKDELFALKLIKSESELGGIPSVAIREIAILIQLKHSNIIKLINYYLIDRNIVIVFEYASTDLYNCLINLNCGLSLQKCKYYLRQILEGISYCHSKKIIHRDFKPQNILINSDDVIKIADFGLAKTIGLPISNSLIDVVSLWYRPFDVILGNSNYNEALDIWSIGCIFAEMLIGKPLFNGINNLDQIYKIMSILGFEMFDEWEECKQFPLYDYGLNISLNCRNNKKVVLRDIITNLDIIGEDLLNKMLQYNPNKRISALQAIEHEFFYY